jgi:hypothetical protein
MPGLANWQHACQKWHLAFTIVQFSFYFFFPPRILILWRICVCVCVCVYTHTHTQTYTYLTARRLYMRYCCYQITLQVKHFYTNQERCEGLTKYLSFRYQPGGDWVNMWHWTEHFTIPAIKSWPEYPNENQMSIQFPVQQLQCFCNDNWMVRTGPFCSHCVCCFLSEHLTFWHRNLTFKF